MTTRITKWNYLRHALPHETVDLTRRGHMYPPLVLNPYQFSELTRLADAGDVVRHPAGETHPLDKKENIDSRNIRHFARPSTRRNQTEKERKNLEILNDTNNEIDQGNVRKSMKQAEEGTVKKEVQPEDSVSQCIASESDDQSHLCVGSTTSMSKKRTQVHTEPEHKYDKAKSAVDNPSGSEPPYHQSKEGPPCEQRTKEAGKGSVRNKHEPLKEELKDSDYWSDSSRSKPVISSDSNTMEHYTFSGLEHTPEMKQLMALRSQLHAMKLQTKKQAEDQAVRCHQSFHHPERIPDNPHYDRWEPKILYEDSSNKELYRKWRKLKREHEKKRRHRKPVRSTEPGLRKEESVDNGASMVSTSSMNSPIPDTYSKAIFQRGGEVEPEKIRKRYVFSETHWLKGDGFEEPERDKWIKKPYPQYITTKKVDSNDPRFCRRAKSASLISLSGSLGESSNPSGSFHCSLSSSKSNHSPIISPTSANRKSDVSGGKSHQREHEKISESQQKDNRRSKSAAPTRSEVKREELPHQKHHDFRRLKEIFSAPRPEYDRLARDRETLTQYEKEMLMLSKLQKAPDKDKMMNAAEKQLAIKEEETPEARSAAMFKQVRKGRVEQLEEKALALQQSLLQEGKWDRRMLLQQRQHLQRLQQKHAQKQEAQKNMRKALTKLIAERRAREREERNAQQRERIEREQQQLQHEHHEQALKKQMAAEKQATLRSLQKQLLDAQQKHDKLDLHYGVSRRKEYRDRKRKMQLEKPRPPLLPSSPRHLSKQAATHTQNAPVFQSVGGQ
ncbi:hypothetical protein FHG87_003991 [Trinorchestia longiramus]|nr:hypothetical protein FHG87_003991 [Trinorchestia longiramus]